MSSQTTQRARVIDKDEKIIESTCSGFEMKSEHGQDYVEGYIATKGVDRGDDLFTGSALKSMTEQINEDIDNVDVYFPSFSEEDLKRASDNVTNNGNVDHNNSPVGGVGNHKIVPAFRIVEANYDGFGIKVKAELNTDGLLPEQQDAIKNSVREGYLNAFSVEFVADEVRYGERDGKSVRMIEKATPRGAAMTGRPVQTRARVTDTNIKSLLDEVEQKVEYAYDIGDTVNWSSSGGQAEGVIEDRTKDETFDSEIDGDFSVEGTEEEPAYLIRVGEGDDATMVGHLQETLAAGGKSAALMQKMSLEEKVEYEYEEGDMVHWSSSGGMAEGVVQERTKDSTFDSEIDGDVSVTGTEEEPAYLIKVGEGEDATMVGHKQGTLNAGNKSFGTKADVDDIDLTPPQGAQEAAQKALDYKQKHDVDAMTETGWDRARQLAKAEPLSPSDIADGTDGMANWWARHEKDFEIEEEHRGEPYNDNGYVAGLGWGGEVGKNWSQRKAKKIEEARESNKARHGYEGQGKQMSLPMDENTQLLYPSESMAMDAGDAMGLQGVHTHTLDGEEMYMPGEDHESFMDAVGKMGSKARHGDDENMDGKAMPTYDGTKTGELDESEIPNDDYEGHYMYPGDTKSDSSYPVVDADGFLRRGNVMAAYQLGARGGVDEDEHDRMLRELNDEFENPPIEAFKEMENNSKSMPEDAEGSTGQNDEAEAEEKSLQETVEEMKSTVSDVKERNDELAEENEELKSELDEYKKAVDLKSDIESIQDEIKSLTPQDRPVAEQTEQKNETESKSELALKSMSEDFVQKHSSALANKHSMTEEEVLDYA